MNIYKTMTEIMDKVFTPDVSLALDATGRICGATPITAAGHGYMATVSVVGSHVDDLAPGSICIEYTSVIPA